MALLGHDLLPTYLLSLKLSFALFVPLVSLLVSMLCVNSVYLLYLTLFIGIIIHVFTFNQSQAITHVFNYARQKKTGCGKKSS